ncbi:MAG: hypothetical protein HQ522_19275 [Bacteroidetes bacterium]|nr:hypothetical protein [Bacteroidota bacterium]
MDLNYVIDKDGKQSAVIVPITEWHKILSRLSKMKKKLDFLTGLEQAVEEVNLIKSGNKKTTSFKDFLDEN